MKVGEMIHKLKEFDQELPVFYDYEVEIPSGWFGKETILGCMGIESIEERSVTYISSKRGFGSKLGRDFVEIADEETENPPQAVLIC